MFNLNHILKLTLLILVCALALNEANDKPGFIATFPSNVLPKQTAKFCIQFFNLNSNVNLTVSDSEPQAFETFSIYYTTNDKQICNDVQIIDLKETVDDKHIKIIGSTDDLAHNFSDDKVFFYKRMISFNLIETDKPVYKPGQKVKIRILSADLNLKPAEREFKEIYIEDSSTSRVSQWLNVKSNGLIQFEMPLSEEPNLGMWRVVLIENDSNEMNQVEFEVKKYVLPKFEVFMNHYDKLRLDEAFLNVTVCAKYTYGKDVSGKFELKAYTKKFSFETYNEEIFKQEAFSQNAKGCHVFTVNTEKIGINRSQYIYKVYLDALVSEADTDLQMNSSSSVEIAYGSIEIFKMEPEFYKPGLPIHFKLVLKSIRGDRVPNQEVTIELEKKNKVFFESKFVSDNNGMIIFDLDCVKQNCDEIFKERAFSKSPAIFSLKVSTKTGEEIPGFEWINNIKRVFSIYPWNSKKLSFIQLYKNSDSTKCGDQMNVRMRIRSTKRLSNDSLYFQLQSRSSILNSGYFNLDTKQSSLNEYSFEIVESSVVNISFVPNKTELDKRCFNSKPSAQAVKLTQVEDYYYYYSKYWYYNQETNRCELEKANSKTDDFFYTKDDCEESCKISDLRFSPTGIPIAKEGFKYECFYDYSIDLKFTIKPEMTPELKILAFFAYDNEIIPDSLTLDLDKCLNNKVNLKVDNNVQVGKNLDIQISTHPNSLCALSAIDKSVTLMGTRNSITFDKIFEKLKNFNLIYDYLNKYKGEDESECNNPDPMDVPMPRPQPNSRKSFRSYYPQYPNTKFYDSTKSFRSSSIIYLSNLGIFKDCKRINFEPSYGVAMPRSGFSRKTAQISLEMSLGSDVQSSSQFDYPSNSASTTKSSSETVIKTIRSNFPETWLFQIDLADENGLIQKKTTSPDTITDWILDAYCLSKQAGLGLSEQQTVRVFQSLFISMDLPYSVIRGETFPVKASVFNYEETCVPINIEILPEKRIILAGKPLIKSVQRCICQDEKITETFYLKAIDFDYEKGFKISARVSSLSSNSICLNESKQVNKLIKFMDLESKNVLVEPEGIPKEHVESYLAVFKTYQNATDQSFEIKLPDNIVPKSSRAYLSITGDALGPVLNNLDHLVQQPTGCGEQNMVKFAPIVYVTDYLKYTDQLTAQLDKTTKEFLKIGYQRQLTYRHVDGSFSAFGSRNVNETGGTWLTAFVLRCLAECYDSNHIDIDLNDITISYRQLLARQSKDGSFSQIGAQLFSKALAGGLKDENVGLSAYVLISLLKSQKAVKPSQNDNSRIQLALSYLKTSLHDAANADLYSLALGLYAFKLAETDSEFVAKLEAELDQRAINKDGLLFWSNSNDNSKSSSALEITSYVLLSKLQDLKKQDVDKVVLISKWINSQRNSLGGFYSTQDTVVALSALSKFASSFYSKAASMQVSFDFSNNNTTFLQINNKNRLLVQKRKLVDFKENDLNRVNFTLRGQGTSLFQLIVKYNLANESKIKEKNDYEFNLVSTESHFGSKCDYGRLIITANYNGAGERSGMTIISVKLPSGWAVIEETVEKLKHTIDLRRFEIVNENRLFLYFDEITRDGFDFDFHANKKYEVLDRKPGLISVYDYYENFDDNVSSQFEINDDCK